MSQAYLRVLSHSQQKIRFLRSKILSKNMIEVVLDNTMGSGSTGVACKNLNRKFIGIELDDTYYEIAKNRINGVPETT